VHRELGELPEVVRSAILLRHVAGLGFDDIARELAIPVGTAKTHVHRGLTEVRERLRRAGSVLSLALLLGLVGELSASDGSPPFPPASPGARPSPTPRTRTGPRPPGIGIIMKTILAVAVIALAIAIPLTRAQDAAPGAAPGGTAVAAAHSYSGTVATATATQVVLFCVPANAAPGSALAKQTVTVNAKTVVTIAGKAAKAADLKEGARVEVAADAADVAISIKAE
jgi:hypothetical protein